MKTQPIATQDNRYSQNRREMLAGSAIGALTGYAAKYALPAGSYEYDTYVTDIIQKGIKDQIEGARSREYRIIREEMRSAAGKVSDSVTGFWSANKENIFKNKKEALGTAVEKLDGEAKNTVKEALKRVDANGLEARHLADKTTQAAVKSFRPTALFIIVGAAVAASIVTLKNALTRPDFQPKQGFSK